MSAFASMNLKNNAGTNVAFSPLTINSSTGVASWATGDAVYDNKTVLTVSSQLPSAKSSKGRMKVKLAVPYLVLNSDGVTYTKKDEEILTIDIAIPKNMALLDRQNAQAFLKSVLTDVTLVTNFMTSFEGIY